MWDVRYHFGHVACLLFTVAMRRATKEERDRSSGHKKLKIPIRGSYGEISKRVCFPLVLEASNKNFQDTRISGRSLFPRNVVWVWKSQLHIPAYTTHFWSNLIQWLVTDTLLINSSDPESRKRNMSFTRSFKTDNSGFFLRSGISVKQVEVPWG